MLMLPATSTVISILRYKATVLYMGQWKDDARYGFGIEKTSRGQTFRGTFKVGVRIFNRSQKIKRCYCKPDDHVIKFIT